MVEPSDTLVRRKAEFRQAAMARRTRIFELKGGAAPPALIDFAKNHEFETPKEVVSGYVPIGSEIDCLALLGALHERGFACCLPLVSAPATALTFLKYQPGDHLIKGKFDVMTPDHTAQRLIPTLLLVPLLAFDRQGYRMGYGGGFYDRTLAQLRKNRPVKAIGLAFSDQQVDAVPHDALDQRLDCVLCESGLIEF